MLLQIMNQSKLLEVQMNKFLEGKLQESLRQDELRDAS